MEIQHVQEADESQGLQNAQGEAQAQKVRRAMARLFVFGFAVSLFLGLANTAKGQETCVPADLVIEQIVLARPDATIQILNQMEAWAFLSRIEELAKFTIPERYRMVSGLILISDPYGGVVSVNYLRVGEICGWQHLPRDLVEEVLNNWPKA